MNIHSLWIIYMVIKIWELYMNVVRWLQKEYFVSDVDSLVF